MSLFGSSTTTSKPTLSLTFPTPSNTTSTLQPQQSGGLFGSAPSTQAGSLFGSAATTSQPQQSSGLFGSTATQPAQGGGLFGGTSTQQPAGGGGLFGSTTQQQPSQQPSGGLFGASQQTKPALGGSLFGTASSSQQQPQVGGGGGLFGSTTQQPQQVGGLFGASTAQQPAAQQGSLLGSLGATANNRSIWQPGSSISSREKSIPEQIATVLNKWNPDSPACVFQHYFYNTVDPNLVPYFNPGPGEDEQKWEEALAKKPSPGSIPVLARGFAAVGERAKVATLAIQGLQTRMHEINNSFMQNIQKHELEATVRAADARRRHVALSQRCLALATKVQVLRNRGYALQGAEEGLKERLQELEKQAFDPVLGGRQEEIWARLSELRDRALLLQEEADKLGAKSTKDEETIDEETMKAIKKLLTDYDSQLDHLKKELDLIKADFDDWESDRKPALRGR